MVAVSECARGRWGGAPSSFAGADPDADIIVRALRDDYISAIRVHLGTASFLKHVISTVHATMDGLHQFQTMSIENKF